MLYVNYISVTWKKLFLLNLLNITFNCPFSIIQTGKQEFHFFFFFNEDRVYLLSNPTLSL